MKSLSDTQLVEVNGGIVWMSAIVAPILVGVSIGISNQIAGAIINNWSAFKAGVKETSI